MRSVVESMIQYLGRAGRSSKAPNWTADGNEIWSYKTDELLSQAGQTNKSA